VSMRQALLLSQGSFAIFFTRPISAACLGIAAVLLLANVIPFMEERRKKIEEIRIKE